MEQTYRPSQLDSFEGQETIVEFLKLKVAAAHKTGKSVGHMLFLGPSGTGKTTLALAFANEMGSPLKVVMANTIRTPEEFMEIVANFNGGEILFIDEIHRLPASVQDGMLDFMESGKVETRNGRYYRCDYKQVTIIGATTHWGNLREAFVQRFGYKAMFSLYPHHQLVDMTCDRMWNAHGIRLSLDVAHQIAKVSLGKARQMATLVDGLVELAQATSQGSVTDSMIDIKLLERLMQLQGYDPFLGLNAPSRAYLGTLYRCGEAVGLEAVARMINQQDASVRDMIEPFLMSRATLPTFDEQGQIVGSENGELIKLTPRGRMITPIGESYVKLCLRLQERGWFAGESFA